MPSPSPSEEFQIVSPESGRVIPPQLAKCPGFSGGSPQQEGLTELHVPCAAGANGNGKAALTCIQAFCKVARRQISPCLGHSILILPGLPGESKKPRSDDLETDFLSLVKMGSPLDSHSNAIPPTGPAFDSSNGESLGLDAQRAEKTIADVEKLLADLPQASSTATGDLPATSDLIEQTRLQIQQLTAEIQQIAQSEISKGEFYAGFLTRVITALASQGGAIWMIEGDRLESKYQVNVDAVLGRVADEAQGRHLELLQRVTQRGQAVLVPPHSRSESDETEDNPTASLLILVPVLVRDEPLGVIEVFQRAGSGPTTQRGYLRFVTQMARHVGTFLQNDRHRTAQKREQSFDRLDRFISEAHRNLNLKSTAFAIVNEGRKLTEVDRVALAVDHGRPWEILAVSGLDSVERRSNEIKWLNRLITRVCEARVALWYDGDDSQLPPQIEEPLHEYLDQSHTKRIAVIPLMTETDSSDFDEEQQIVGCLVFEQISKISDTTLLEERVNALRPHAAQALANAVEMHRLPLASVLQKCDRWMQWFHAKNLPTTILVAAAVFAVLAGLALIPMTFEVGCDGQLVPEIRRDVFAPTHGMVSAILIDDDPNLVIQKNSPLIEMTDEELLDDINQLEGRKRQLEQRIESLRKDTVENYAQLTLLEEQKLQSQMDEAKTELEAVRQSLVLKLKELELLKIQSPIEGRLIDWQVTQKLYRRYVQRGQVLVSLVDPEGPWRVELALPEKRLKHVRERVEKNQAVPVTLVLASLPGRSFQGEIEWVDHFATVDPVAGNSIQVRVSMNKDELPPEVRVAGARVSAKIDCGSRSSGYVLFHDVWDTFQQRVLFWIW